MENGKLTSKRVSEKKIGLTKANTKDSIKPDSSMALANFRGVTAATMKVNLSEATSKAKARILGLMVECSMESGWTI